MPDRMSEYSQFMKSHFVGFQLDQPLMTFDDNTSTTLGVTTGHKIKAKGWVKIGNLIHSQGTMQDIDIPVAPHHLWVADLTLTFRYKGFTHGEKWIYPGGVFVDNVWDSVHPEGSVTIHLKVVPGSNFLMGVSVTVDPGHDDRPNKFISDLAKRTGSKADTLTEEFTGQSVAFP